MATPQHSQTTAPDLDSLFETYVAAFHIWLELYRDDGCWTDAPKRQAMLRARAVYQDAQVHYATVLTDSMGQERFPWASV